VNYPPWETKRPLVESGMDESQRTDFVHGTPSAGRRRTGRAMSQDDLAISRVARRLVYQAPQHVVYQHGAPAAARGRD
jgi:hypothetical protein